MSRSSAIALVAVWLAGCQICNYLDPAGPRYAGMADPVAPDPEPDVLRVVSFNIEWAERIDGAIETLRSDDALRSADIVLLQEMDAEGTATIAGALGLHHVYYPIAFRRGQQMGNAILSRWPIVEDHKLILPHPSPMHGQRRLAVGATIDAPGGSVAVYVVHVCTAVQSLRGRLEQLARVLEDAEARHPRGRPVIVGGDFNTFEPWSVARVREGFAFLGYQHATRTVDATADYFFGTLLLDHVFVRGLEVLDAGAVPTDASDHRALWTALVAPGAR